MSFSPATKAESFVLAEIRFRESGNDYASPPRNPPYATASGAYQFIIATWLQAWRAVYGAVASPGFAYQARFDQQDACALWLLRTYGANSKHAWAASGPYPSIDEIQFALEQIGVNG